MTPAFYTGAAPGGNEVRGCRTRVWIEASSQATTQSLVDVAALSDNQNQNYQPATINDVADSPVSNSNSPNFAGGTEFCARGEYGFSAGASMASDNRRRARASRTLRMSLCAGREMMIW